MTPPRLAALAFPLTARLSPTPWRRDTQLAAIEEMLERLETVTRAGQQHLMSKIVAVLVAHPRASAAGLPVTARVQEMRREADKAAPDGARFARAAQAVVAKLASL